MTKQKLLETAAECVCGEREEDYGKPEENFARIAKLWSIYTGIEITPTDVASMMILLKIARIMSGHGKSDNWVDIAGYAACGGELDAL